MKKILEKAIKNQEKASAEEANKKACLPVNGELSPQTLVLKI